MTHRLDELIAAHARARDELIAELAERGMAPEQIEAMVNVRCSRDGRVEDASTKKSVAEHFLDDLAASLGFGGRR